MWRCVGARWLVENEVGWTGRRKFEDKSQERLIQVGGGRVWSSGVVYPPFPTPFLYSLGQIGVRPGEA